MRKMQINYPYVHCNFWWNSWTVLAQPHSDPDCQNKGINRYQKVPEMLSLRPSTEAPEERGEGGVFLVNRGRMTLIN